MCVCVCVLVHNLVGRVFTNSQETRILSQVGSYQRLKNQYLMLPCLTLSIIRYGSRVKWSNPGKGVVPYPHLGLVAMEKKTLGHLRLGSPT